MIFYWFVKGIFYPFVRLYLGLQRVGLSHVPRRGPLIVVCNHVSYMDAILLGSAVPRPVRFMVLQWMYDLLFIRWFYWGMGTVPVQADGRDRNAIRSAIKALDRGHAVGIFPEGTRSPDGRVGETRPGAAMLAALSGAPVVPAFIDGGRESMPVGARFPAPARVQVRFGPPLLYRRDEMKRDRNGMRKFAQTIEDAIRRLGPDA